jgi:hypothetical protein
VHAPEQDAQLAMLHPATNRDVEHCAKSSTPISKRRSRTLRSKSALRRSAAAKKACSLAKSSSAHVPCRSHSCRQNVGDAEKRLGHSACKSGSRSASAEILKGLCASQYCGHVPLRFSGQRP